MLVDSKKKTIHTSQTLFDLTLYSLALIQLSTQGLSAIQLLSFCYCFSSMDLTSSAPRG